MAKLACLIFLFLMRNLSIFPQKISIISRVVQMQELCIGTYWNAIQFLSFFFILGVIYDNKSDTGPIFIVMGVSMIGCSILSLTLPVLTKVYYQQKARKLHHIESQLQIDEHDTDLVQSDEGYVFMTHL